MLLVDVEGLTASQISEHEVQSVRTLSRSDIFFSVVNKPNAATGEYVQSGGVQNHAAGFLPNALNPRSVNRGSPMFFAKTTSESNQAQRSK